MRSIPPRPGPASPPEWDLLLSASQKNKAGEVRRLLEEEGVPPSHSNVVGQTSLHIAALWGSVEAMQILIEAGADVNAQNRIAGTAPLHCAVKGTFQSFKETHCRRVQCVALLLEAGADPKLCDMRGRDAFDAVDDAIQESAMRKMGNIEDEMEEMREALKSGALNNMSPLARCIDAIDVAGVKESLGDDGMDLTKSLRAAVAKFKLLVDEGNCDSSAYGSLKDIIHEILEAGADPNSSPLEEAPLHIICSSICSTRRSEWAVVDVAADIVLDLVAHGAEIGPETQSLLPAAAHRGTIQIVAFLLKSVGVDCNTRGRQGMTALMFASRRGKLDVVELLLENETLDVDISDDAGKKAVDYARANGMDQIVQLLSKESEKHRWLACGQQLNAPAYRLA